MKNRMKKTLFYNLIDGIRSLEFPSLIQKEEYSKTYFSESDYDRLRKDYRKSIEGIRKMKWPQKVRLFGVTSLSMSFLLHQKS